MTSPFSLRKVHKLLAPVDPASNREALGQIGGSGNLEADIGLCPLQTIEPFMMKYLPKEGKILEAGSGRGRWVFYLRREGFDVVGIEIAHAEVSAAKAFDPGVPISIGNVLATGLPDRSFDAVISLGVVEHFEDGPGKALEEVRRILKPGGCLLITVPTQNFARVAFFNRIKSVQNIVRKSKGRELQFEEYRYSRRQFETFLDAAGFEIIERAPDDFRPPHNMGLYTESRFVQHPSLPWQLNRPGRVLVSMLGLFSPWLYCSGTLWVCRPR